MSHPYDRILSGVVPELALAFDWWLPLIDVRQARHRVPDIALHAPKYYFGEIATKNCPKLLTSAWQLPGPPLTVCLCLSFLQTARELESDTVLGRDSQPERPLVRVSPPPDGFNVIIRKFRIFKAIKGESYSLGVCSMQMQELHMPCFFVMIICPFTSSVAVETS